MPPVLYAAFVFPMLDDPVGGVLRPGKHYAIFGLQRLAYLGNTAP